MVGSKSKALRIAFQHGCAEGAHHKQWVIAQMVRALCADDEDYKDWVAEFEKGEDGPKTYVWDEGIAP